MKHTACLHVDCLSRIIYKKEKEKQRPRQEYNINEHINNNTRNLGADGCPSKENLFGQSLLLMK